MSKEEIEVTSIAEMRSMIAAMQIAEGKAKQKQTQQTTGMSYEEVLNMR